MSVRLVSPLAVVLTFSVTAQNTFSQVDFDQDGVADVIVRDPVPPDYGSANNGRIVIVSGTSASPIAEIPSPLANSAFGFHAELIFDVDGGGMHDLFVAAPGAFITSKAVGRIHLFRGEDFSELFTLAPPKGAILGWNLSLTRDLDSDGFNDLIASGFASNTQGVLEPSWLLYSGSDGRFLGYGNDSGSVVDAMSFRPLATAIRYPDADVNKDGIVDYLDIAEIAQLVGQNVEPASPGDVVVSGKIDSNDVAAIHGAFGAQYDPLDPEYFEEALPLPSELPNQHGAMRAFYCRLFDSGFWPIDFFGGSDPAINFQGSTLGLDCFSSVDPGCTAGPLTLGLDLDPANPDSFVSTLTPTDSAAWFVPEGDDQLTTITVASDGTSMQLTPLAIAAGRTVISASVTTDCSFDRTLSSVWEHEQSLHDLVIDATSTLNFGQTVALTVSHTAAAGETVSWAISYGADRATLSSNSDGSANLFVGGRPGWVSVRAEVGGVERLHLLQIKPLPGVDSDQDGILDECEAAAGSDALDESDGGEGVDRDLDGLWDIEECTLGTDHRNHDTDGDGLNDGLEVDLGITDPLLYDTDGDGISDGEEDADNDGLSNYLEQTYRTDLLNNDTDGDGESDGTEVGRGSDPNRINSLADAVPLDSEVYTARFFVSLYRAHSINVRFGNQSFSFSLNHPTDVSGWSGYFEAMVRPGHIYGLEITDFSWDFDIPGLWGAESYVTLISVQDSMGNQIVGRPGTDSRRAVAWQDQELPPYSDHVCGIGWGHDAIKWLPGFVAFDPFGLFKEDNDQWDTEHQKTVTNTIRFVGIGATSPYISTVIGSSWPDPNPGFGGISNLVPGVPTGHVAILFNKTGKGFTDIEFQADPGMLFETPSGGWGGVYIPQGSSVSALLTRRHIADDDGQIGTYNWNAVNEQEFAFVGPYERRHLIDYCDRTIHIVDNWLARYDAFEGERSPARMRVFQPAAELLGDVDNNQVINLADRKLGDQGEPQLVSSGDDSDGDLVPDFADWSWTETPFDSLTPQTHFEEIQIGLSDLPSMSGADEATTILIEYSYSDPDQISIDTDGDYDEYTAGPGAFRIWTHDGLDRDLDPRPIRDGGDLIVPGIEYSMIELASAITNTPWDRDTHFPVYLETVSLPTAANERSIKLTTNNPLDTQGAEFYPWHDEIVVEPIGIQFRSVDGNTIGPVVDEPVHSHPVPEIQSTVFEMASFEIDPFSEEIMGDLQINLSISDQLSDLLLGSFGEIHTLTVAYTETDGSNAEINLPAQVTKGTANSISAPYPYLGTINDSVQVPLQPGSNTVQLIAKNSMGHRAILERTWDVSVETPEIVREYELNFSYPESPEFLLVAPVVQVRHRLVVDEEWSPYIQLTDPDLDGVYHGDGDFSEVTLVIPQIPDVIPNEPDVLVGTISNLGEDEASLFLRETGDDTWIFEGHYLVQAEYDDIPIFDAEIELSPGSDELFLGGSGVNTYVMELFGNAAMLEQVSTVEIDGSILFVHELNGQHFASLSPDQIDAMFVSGYGDSETLRDELGYTFYDRDETIDRYLKGVVAGIYGTGADLVSGVIELAKMGGRACIRYVPGPAMVYKLIDPEGLEAGRQADKKALLSAWDTSQEVATVIYRLAAHESDIFIRVMQGDLEAILEQGEEMRLAYQFGHELLRAAEFELNTADPYDLGFVVGRIIGEILLEVVSLGSGTAINVAAKSAVVPSVVSKLKLIRIVDNNPALKAKFDNIADYAATVLATTEMCFAAGTMVHTSSGLKAIESIELGDLVLARDEFTGQVGFKPVIDLIRTQPDEILEVTFDIDGRLETIRTTPEHPFFLHESGAFTLAGELAGGDRISSASVHPWSQSPAAAAVVVSAVSVPNTGPEAEPTYNFEVADWHTYHVGETGLWVHNTSRKACEQLKSWIDTYINHDQLTPSQAWERVEQSVLNGTPNIIPTRTIDDETMGLAVELLLRDLRTSGGRYVPPDSVSLFTPISGNSGSGTKLFRKHYIKHVIDRGEFQGAHGAPVITNALDYADHAVDFLLEPHSTTTKLVGLRDLGPDGIDKIVVDLQTGEYAACTTLPDGSVGSIRTYFQLNDNLLQQLPGNTRAEKIEFYFNNNGIKADGVVINP